MLIADALRALVPHARTSLAFTAFTTASAPNAGPLHSANDAGLALPAARAANPASPEPAQPHVAWHRSAIVHQQAGSGEQLSLLDAPAAGGQARPLELIRRPRPASPRSQRQARGARVQTTMSNLASPVQRHSAAAANDASIKMFWGPAGQRAGRSTGWAIAGRMADVCAELERLERLEHVS
ncbi:MAG: hypothetical protein ACN6O3_20300 [Comamonas sp.]